MIFHGLIRDSDQIQHNFSTLAWSSKTIRAKNIAGAPARSPMQLRQAAVVPLEPTALAALRREYGCAESANVCAEAAGQRRQLFPDVGFGSGAESLTDWPILQRPPIEGVSPFYGREG
jgi:hypothetical protein